MVTEGDGDHPLPPSKSDLSRKVGQAKRLEAEVSPLLR